MKALFTRILPRLFCLFVAMAAAVFLLLRYFEKPQVEALAPSKAPSRIAADLETVNAAFEKARLSAGVLPTPEADPYTLIRRLSLALTGAPPSLEEIRRLEGLPKGADPVQAWLDHLFSDRRYADQMAERFARVFVGVETGPFLVYRRRRLVTWLGDQLAVNRRYDHLVQDLIASEGLWTSRPETNFITVSVVQGGGGPDEVKLAARTSRAFLGISLDCVQCHDDKFGDRWKQADFHQLAAYFAQADTTITGVREKKDKVYETRFLGDTEASRVEPKVPYAEDLVDSGGSRRGELARWVTHPDNTAFARATVNRVWAILFGRPLVDPVDDIPLTGPYPAGLEELAVMFTKTGYDLQHLIRVIAASDPFHRESRSGDPDHPVTADQEAVWAAFPITPLRPDQVAGGIIQAGSLQALDSTTHILQKLRRFGETQQFVKRYGDPGEDTFAEESGTIPQRLLLMNGNLVKERTDPNPVMNSSTRIADYAPSDQRAVEAAFLAALTRYPNEEERVHFADLISGTTKKNRELALADLYWALINSTEFSWNR